MLVTLELPPRPRTNDKFIAVLPDGERLGPSDQPMYETGRALRAGGVPDGTLVEFRHKDSSIIAARQTVGWLAERMVKQLGQGPRQFPTGKKFPLPYSDGPPEEDSVALTWVRKDARSPMLWGTPPMPTAA